MLAPLLPLRQREEAGRDGMAEPAAAEVHADPHLPVLVGEHVYVVIAAPDGTELVSRLGAEAVPLVAARNGVPGSMREQGMVRGRVVGAIGAAYAERDGALNLVRQALELGSGEVIDPAVGADRRVAASDVEPDAHDADLVAVRRHTS